MPLINGPRQNLHWSIGSHRREAQRFPRLCIEPLCRLAAKYRQTGGSRLSVEVIHQDHCSDHLRPFDKYRSQTRLLPEHVQFLFLPSVVHEIGRD